MSVDEEPLEIPTHMPIGVEHKTMRPVDWETAEVQAGLYTRGMPPNTHDPETGVPLNPDVDRALDVAQIVAGMKDEGITDPTPQQVADRLEVPIGELAGIFTQGLQVLAQMAESIAQAVGAPPAQPNRLQRRLAKGKGPKRIRHGSPGAQFGPKGGKR